MKQGDIKRALLVLTVLCISLFVYLYWQQSADVSINYQNVIYAYRRPSRTSDRKPKRFQWTWQCINQRCERQPIRADIPTVALSTCNMLCGSTQLWPQPTGLLTLGTRVTTIHHSRIFYDEEDVAMPARQLIAGAVVRFNATIASLVREAGYLQRPPDAERLVIRIRVADPHVVRLRLATSEAYNLTVRSHDGIVEANVVAPTFFGARHALETLAQLIWWDEYEDALKILKGAAVQDAPAFAYRGLMLDTARNFISLDGLRRVLNGMAANKLNVFHWHISDSQSFPFDAPRVPEMARAGAYSSDMIYTAEDVRYVVEFARVHGIRVVIEIDAPAHAGNGWTWGPEAGLGELAVCVNERPWSLYCGEPPCGQLNPDNPNVYDVLEKLYADIIELSGEDELFHLGGDEVNLECWAQHLPRSTQANYTDLHDLWGDFTLKALKRLKKVRGDSTTSARVIMWSSNLSKRPYVNRYIDKNSVVVQSWGASQWPDTPDLIADGYSIIVSHVDAWYLDCGFGRWRETGEAACDPYRPWQTVYNHRPWQQLRLDKKRVMGGEVCLWGEQLDEASLDTRLWPRAAAFAERVWSDPQLDLNTYSISEDVYTRLDTQRRRLLERGLQAEALWPAWCQQNPGRCL